MGELTNDSPMVVQLHYSCLVFSAAAAQQPHPIQFNPSSNERRCIMLVLWMDVGLVVKSDYSISRIERFIFATQISARIQTGGGSG